MGEGGGGGSKAPLDSPFLRRVVPGNEPYGIPSPAPHRTTLSVPTTAAALGKRVQPRHTLHVQQLRQFIRGLAWLAGHANRFPHIFVDTNLVKEIFEDVERPQEPLRPGRGN